LLVRLPRRYAYCCRLLVVTEINVKHKKVACYRLQRFQIYETMSLLRLRLQRAARNLAVVFSQAPARNPGGVFSQAPARNLGGVFSQAPARNLGGIFSQAPARNLGGIFSQAPARNLGGVFSQAPAGNLGGVFPQAGLQDSNSGLRLKFAGNGHILVVFGPSNTRNGWRW